MKAGLDQMTAWLLAIVLSSALFGAGYGVTRLAGRGEHHDDAHGESHGDEHSSAHGDSHSAGDGHSSPSHGDHGEQKGQSHGDSHGADSHGSDGEGHGDAKAKGHDDGHGGGHQEESHSADAHGDKNHGKAGHTTDTHNDDSHSKDAHGKDTHGKDAHGKDTHGKDAHGKDAHGKDAHGKDAHGKDGEHGHDGASEKAPSSAGRHAFVDESTVNGVKWGYTGALGPAYWADLSPNFSVCRTGRKQSPIDIDETGANPKLLPIRFSYKELPVAFENSGLSVDGFPAAGSYVEVDGERYDLRRVRFHTPSEHKVAGAPYDMEMQLMHSSADGDRIHLSVFFEEGSTHRGLEKLWAHLPEEVGRPGDSTPFNFETLLPGRRVYFHYQGSLTTPPCTEGVKWFVLSQSVEASSKQIDQLSSLVLRSTRPIAPLNGRKVVRSSR